MASLDRRSEAQHQFYWRQLKKRNMAAASLLLLAGPEESMAAIATPPASPIFQSRRSPRSCGSLFPKENGVGGGVPCSSWHLPPLICLGSGQGHLAPPRTEGLSVGQEGGGGDRGLPAAAAQLRFPWFCSLREAHVPPPPPSDPGPRCPPSRSCRRDKRAAFAFPPCFHPS